MGENSNINNASNVMIGTWAWGAGMNGSSMIFGNKQDPNVLRESFEKAVNLGFRKWDTAAVYGMGSCETFLGRLIENHEDLYISTKFMPDKKYKNGNLSKSLHDSLARLGREHADLFWIHVPNNLEDNLKEAIPHIKDGQIKAIGISNVSLEHIKQAQKLLGQEGLSLGAVQNHFSLLRNDQQPIIDYCNANGIEYYAYMVLEQGALSGHYNAKNHFPTLSMRGLAFPKSKFKKIESLLQKMKELADKYEVDSSQIPILWAIGKGSIPIIGITKPSHAEKLAAAMAVSLSKEELNMLDQEAAATGIRQQGVWEPQ